MGKGKGGGGGAGQEVSFIRQNMNKFSFVITFRHVCIVYWFYLIILLEYVHFSVKLIRKTKRKAFLGSLNTCRRKWIVYALHWVRFLEVKSSNLFVCYHIVFMFTIYPLRGVCVCIYVPDDRSKFIHSLRKLWSTGQGFLFLTFFSGNINFISIRMTHNSSVYRSNHNLSMNKKKGRT